MVFTKKEIELLSDGLIALINMAGEAKKLVWDSDSQKVIDEYTNKLQKLNTKICSTESKES